MTHCDSWKTLVIYGEKHLFKDFSAAYNTHSNTSSNTIKDFVSVGHSNLTAFAQPATGRRAPVFQGDFHRQKGNDKNDCK